MMRRHYFQSIRLDRAKPYSVLRRWCAVDDWKAPWSFQLTSCDIRLPRGAVSPTRERNAVGDAQYHKLISRNFCFAKSHSQILTDEIPVSYKNMLTSWAIKQEEASTHRSAKTNVGTVLCCDRGLWHFDFKNGLSGLIVGNLFVKFCDLSCVGFEILCG